MPRCAPPVRERPRERRLDDRNLDERMFPVDHPDHKVKVLSTRVPVWRFFRRRSCAPATAVLFKSNVADAGWQTRVLADRSRLPRRILSSTSVGYSSRTTMPAMTSKPSNANAFHGSHGSARGTG
jgi:hypothetical protein